MKQSRDDIREKPRDDIGPKQVPVKPNMTLASRGGILRLFKFMQAQM